MIECRQAEKLFGSTKAQREKQHKGFCDVTFTIPDGQVVGVFGENGAGKSTLMMALAGITDLTAGSILYDGKPVADQYENFAYISADGSYFPDMTPREYMSFLSGIFPRFDTKRYERLLCFFDLDAAQKIGKMSTGQRAKLEVAAGMAKRAKYLLMDEPFLGKDIFTRRDFMKLMAGSLRGEETILIASHYIDEIEPFIDRAIVLHKSYLVADVMLDDLRENGETLTELLQRTTEYDANKAMLLFADEDDDV